MICFVVYMLPPLFVGFPVDSLFATYLPCLQFCFDGFIPRPPPFQQNEIKGDECSAWGFGSGLTVGGTHCDYSPSLLLQPSEMGGIFLL